MPRYCLALDLKDDPGVIAEYEKYHQRIWPEITHSIKSSGVVHLEIYRLGIRLFMIMDTTDDFSFDKKTLADQNTPRVQEWETLMWKYQQAIPGGKPGEKWRLMQKIFDLEENG